MQDKEDLSNAVLLAQLVADHHIKGGFIKQDTVFTEYKTSATSIAMDAVALDVLQQAISSGDELSALKTTLETLQKIADKKGNSMFSMFEGQCKKKDIYIFQIHPCNTIKSGDVVTLGAFYMHPTEEVGRNFFFKIYNTWNKCIQGHTAVYL